MFLMSALGWHCFSRRFSSDFLFSGITSTNRTSERKIHTEAMPLLGGAAVFCAFAANVVFNYLILLPLASRVDLPFIEMPDVKMYLDGAFSVWPKLLVIVLGGGLMVALGMYDDKYEIKARTKLIAQIVIALLVALAGMRATVFIHNTFRELYADGAVDRDYYERDELPR